MRRVQLLVASIVLVDTLFFAALTPLLPHYADRIGLDKTGAGVLAGAYPAGAFFGAIPSGIVAARLGVKPTVLVGMTFVALTTAAFGFADSAWQLDLARFCQGLASSFSWTGALAWLVAAAPPGRRGALIGQAFAAAIAGALLGPVLGGIASVAGTGWTFGVVAIASLGVAAWAAATPAVRPVEPQPLGVLGSALAYVLYFALIARAGASRAILVTYLVPAFALVYGWLILGEAVTASALAGLALILGGAIGNLIDRVWHGYVIDYVLFHLPGWSFAIFNLADAFITVGAGLVLLEEFLGWWRQRTDSTT